MPDLEWEFVTCQVCKKQKRLNEAMPAEMIRPSILETIRKEIPNFSTDGYICLSDLNHFRSEHVEDILESGIGEITHLEEDVLRSIKEQELLTRDINEAFDSRLTFGDRLADRIADVGGSWGFIIGFGVFCFLWMGLNVWTLLARPFDPYPFILLNLVLSCMAAVQAPVIMMSQNRQESKDRLRSEEDYRINLKAELEIRQINEKLDFLITNQWYRLLEIQKIQMEMMEQILPENNK